MAHGTKKKAAANGKATGSEAPVLAGDSQELTTLEDRRAILEAKTRKLSQQGYEAALNEAIAKAAGWDDEATKARKQARGFYAGVRRLKELLDELPEPEKKEEAVEEEAPSAPD